MPQSRQDIIELLASIGREPNRRLGQHFMIDAALIERLAAEAGPADGPVLLEVGPGTGTLTEALLAGGGEVRVVAVEIDPHLADLLESRLGGRLRLVRGDALATKHRLNPEMVEALAQLSQGSSPVRLVANLPYNIASPLVAELIGLAWRTAAGRADPPVPIDRLVFTVQREVADRLTAGPGTKDYGPLSVLVQGLGRIQTLVRKISPNAFYPKPNVHSGMVRVDLSADRLGAVRDLDALHATLEAGFGHRRKTLAASIRLAGAETAVRLTAAAAAVGLDLARRGETLNVAEYLAWAEAASADR